MVSARPQARLRPLVARYTGYRIEGAKPGVHRGLPSRHLTFIVTLDGTVDLAAMPNAGQPPTSFTTLVGGLHATAALISHDGHQHGIQLHLTPLGGRVLLGLPAGELANTVVELSTLLGPVAGELVERLRLSASHGQVQITALAKEVGWSRRHLGERFRREFGLTPKVAGRVMRFEVAHRLLQGPQRPGLAEVAARAGFYDQAHLHREWRELAGCTPSRWLAEELPSVDDSGAEGGASSVT